MSTEPEFTPDWPHGWKIRNGSTEIVSIVGRMHNGMIAFETSNVNVTIRHPNGQYGGIENSALDIINKPAPKREIWLNIYEVEANDGFITIEFLSKDEADEEATDQDEGWVLVGRTHITEGDGLEGGAR